MVIISKNGIDYSELEFLKVNGDKEKKAEEIKILCEHLGNFLDVKYTKDDKGRLEKYEIPIENLMCLIRFLSTHPHIKIMCDQMVEHINFKSDKINYIG